MVFVEEWRPVTLANFSHLYEVSNTGRVRSLDRSDFPMVGGGIRKQWSRKFAGKELKASVNSRGYPVVYLRNAPVYKNVPVHRLVALAFIPNPENLPEINHIDGIKTNPMDVNLEWTSRLRNHLHADDNGLLTTFRRKLTDLDIVEIKTLAAAGHSNTGVAARFGVNQSTVSRIVCGLRRQRSISL